MKVLEKNGQVIEGNFEEKEVKEAFWHTSAHVLAQAVKRLYPDTKCAIGPAIEMDFTMILISLSHLQRKILQQSKKK